jgi:hypothetical protein
MKRIVDKPQDIYGMSRIGYSGNLEVYVNTDDGGNIPHFHVRDKDDWGKFHCCIKILSPEYFAHEGKEDKLNSKQRKDLYKFMNSKISNKKYADRFDNNWQLVCFLWDINNSSVEVPEDAEMPDYRFLK